MTAMVLGPDTESVSLPQIVSRPPGPLDRAERLDAVRGALVSLLDLWSPTPVTTTSLLDCVPRGDHARVRSQLNRLEGEGWVRSYKLEGYRWWVSAIDLHCHVCVLEPVQLVTVVDPSTNPRFPWWTTRRRVLACADHGLRVKQ